MLKIKIMFLLLFIVGSISNSWGFTITQPEQGAVFYPGDTVTVKTETTSGEIIKVVVFAVSEIGGVGDLWPPYEFVFTIDPEFVGTAEIIAIAKLEDGTAIQAKVQIQVALPINIRLQGIKINPDDFILLEKLPLGSDPNDVRIAETESISVFGEYTDGINRELTSGTTYTSNDEQVATVSPEGKVTAQGIGEAKVIVVNGNFRSLVDVIVKPYKR